MDFSCCPVLFHGIALEVNAAKGAKISDLQVHISQ